MAAGSTQTKSYDIGQNSEQNRGKDELVRIYYTLPCSESLYT